MILILVPFQKALNVLRMAMLRWQSLRDELLVVRSIIFVVDNEIADVAFELSEKMFGIQWARGLGCN